MIGRLPYASTRQTGRTQELQILKFKGRFTITPEKYTEFVREFSLQRMREDDGLVVVR